MIRDLFDQIVELISQRDSGPAGLVLLNAQLRAPYPSLDDLLNDFAAFAAHGYLLAELSYEDANSALNRMYPSTNFKVPEPFFDVYLAFEDSECDDTPDDTARPRVKKVYAARFAV